MAQYLELEGVKALKSGLEGEISTAQSAAEAVANAKVASVSATNKSIDITYDDADTTKVNPKIAVKLDPATDNAITLTENGLKVGIAASTAVTTSLADEAGYYTSDNVEGALAEVGAVIDGLGTASEADIATTAITEESTDAGLVSAAQVATFVKAEVAGLTGAVHFRGIVTKLEDITDPKSGDMAIVGVKEYIYNGTTWQELGDEGAYVTKEDGKSLVADTEIARLAAMSDGANKVEASTTNGNIKIDGTETTVYTPDEDTVIDADYAHITVTEKSVSDGTTTFEVDAIPVATIQALFD